MPTARKKPVALEWQGGLLSGGDRPLNDALNNSKANATKPFAQAAMEGGPATHPWTGKLRVRREVKGRGGHPAFVLYEF